MNQAALSGFGLSFSLILAIGAQNAFVLKQGLRREYIGWVCLICALSDAILILSGVYGFKALTVWIPGVEAAARLGGSVFLLIYGLRSLMQAWRGGQALQPNGAEPTTGLARVVLLCLAFTWLNPHVYLDTVMLIGAVSLQYERQTHAFAAGAVLASVVFFYSLGYGARLLAPWFSRPQAWRVLDALVGFIMLWLAFRLLLG